MEMLGIVMWERVGGGNPTYTDSRHGEPKSPNADRLAQAKSGRNDGMLSGHLLGRSVHQEHGGALLTLLLAACLLVCAPGVQAGPAQPQPTATKSPAGASAAFAATVPPAAAGRSMPNTVTSGREAMTLRRQWGIDDIHLRSTASGALIRLSYRVVDADKAKILNKKKATPYLVDDKNGLALQIPNLEQVGQLRQVSPPRNGREYWMAFSNKGRSVKPGSHVTVIIGSLRISGLVVE